AKSIPVLIGALAAILGIGGIATKVKSFFQALSKPVMKAVDWVVGKIVGLGKKIWAKLKAKARGGDDSPAGKQKRLDAGMAAAVKVLDRYAGRPVTKAVVTPMLAAIRIRYGLASLDVVPDGENWTAVGKVNPSARAKSRAKNLDPTIEEERRAQVIKSAPARSRTFLDRVFDDWWKRQLGRAKLWGDTSVLDKEKQQAVEWASAEPVADTIYRKFFAGRPNDPAGDNAWVTEVFGNKSTVRVELVGRVGRLAAARLRPDVLAANPGNELYERMAFVPGDGHYGRFDPFPVRDKDADPDLVAAVNGRIIGFLEAIGQGATIGGIDFAKFKELWTKDTNSRDWIKNQFREADGGKHEWIPTNYIPNVLEFAVSGGSRNAVAQNAKRAADWIRLHDAFRSFTSHVIWELTLKPITGPLGKDELHVHVGTFFDGRSPMFNGRDGYWHDTLRGYFDRFTRDHPQGSAGQFMKIMTHHLLAGHLMWNGDSATIAPELRGRIIDATYKLVTATPEGKLISIERKPGLSVEDLCGHHRLNFLQVVEDFERAAKAISG
ncbi:hypothetical protein, partial [Actinoplanes sp. NBRC 103695]|uniref:hypothetical protein n=1 Tax=Actinoplanes sp. NBRC 103695 TaxID=3032202 RepID=UPI0025556DCB